MTLNLLFLGLVALLPFATDLMGEYDDAPEAAAVFACTIALVSLTHWTMARYSVRRGLLPDESHRFAQPAGWASPWCSSPRSPPPTSTPGSRS